jgi:hypothetical protein
MTTKQKFSDIAESIVNMAFVYDTTGIKPELILEKSNKTDVIIVNKHKYNQLVKCHDNNEI